MKKRKGEEVSVKRSSFVFFIARYIRICSSGLFLPEQKSYKIVIIMQLYLSRKNAIVKITQTQKQNAERKASAEKREETRWNLYSNMQP